MAHSYVKETTTNRRAFGHSLCCRRITDNITRMLAPALEKTTGRAVVVECKPGASDLIAANFVQNARSAGTITLMMQSIEFVGLPYMNKAAKFDPLKDFTPVCTVADGAAYVYVNGNVAAKTLTELIAYVKTQPGGVDAATPAWAARATCGPSCCRVAPASSWCRCPTRAALK